jgi:hypothetical protein
LTIATAFAVHFRVYFDRYFDKDGESDATCDRPLRSSVVWEGVRDMP